MLVGEPARRGVMVPSGLRSVAPEPVYTGPNGYLSLA